MRSTQLKCFWTHVAFVAVLAVACSVLPALPSFAAATVNFSGFAYNGLFSGPLTGGNVIAATFAPTFNPTDIPCTYGDSSCNVGIEFISLGVADGNIRPIGSFATVGGDGSFSGSGSTNEPAGTPIYLIAYQPWVQYAAVLATSNHSSYVVPATGGTTSIHTLNANSFVFGFKAGQGIAVNGTPIPEPAAASLMLLAASLSTLGLHRRLRFS
jgi:hypothetical protein